MKKILMIIACLFSFVIGNAESISPNENTEFCPNTEYTFTIVLPKSLQNLTVYGGCTITQQPTLVSGTTYTFKGKFNDANQKQTFRANYNDGSFFNFDFRKIKSLFYNACTPISPNTNHIQAEICKVLSFPISFNNLTWKTEYESPTFCFGSITTYEYLLPSGWSLNGTVSTGSWMAANNSVTVTSDLTGGDGQYIQIRAVNSACGSSLIKGAPVSILVSRPAPPLSISGATQLCYPNSYNYTISGVPSGATVTWQSNSYYSSSPSGNTVTITPTSSANGGTNVTASVYLPTCGLTFTKSFPISIGLPTVTFNINGYPYPEPNCYEVFGIYTFQAQQATGYPNTYTGFDWGWRNLTNNTVSSDPTIYGSQYTFFPYDAGTYEIWVKPTNSCGSGTTESVKTVTVVESCLGGFRMQSSTLTVYPNPTKGQVKIVIPTEYRKNGILQVANQFGNVVLTRKVPTDAQTMDIDISKFGNGIYQLTLKSSKSTLQTKLIKQ